MELYTGWETSRLEGKINISIRLGIRMGNVLEVNRVSCERTIN